MPLLEQQIISTIGELKRNKWSFFILVSLFYLSSWRPLTFTSDEVAVLALFWLINSPNLLAKLPSLRAIARICSQRWRWEGWSGSKFYLLFLLKSCFGYFIVLFQPSSSRHWQCTVLDSFCTKNAWWVEIFSTIKRCFCIQSGRLSTSNVFARETKSIFWERLKP